jgi:large subunit ribosomal protein L5
MAEEKAKPATPAKGGAPKPAPGAKPDSKPAPGAKPAAAPPAAAPAPAPKPAPAPRVSPAASTPPKAKRQPKLPVEKKVSRHLGHKMRMLSVTKVTVNIGVGQSGDRLEKAEKVLGGLTSCKPVRTVSRSAIRDWNLREGQPIGVKVTIRGDEAIAFVKRALWTRNFRVAEWSFDREGNLNFGVPDHTSFEGQKYNPEIGIFGMDIAVTVERPGFRIKHRSRLTRSVPRSHRVTREESQAFLKEVLGMEIV